MMSDPPPPPFPVSYTFRPKPLGCILYLDCKVTSKPFPYEAPIFDLDPYNLKQLADILSSLENKEAVYLFTKLPSRTKGGRLIIDRHVGRGIWRHDRVTDNIIDSEGKLVGMSRQLTFLEKGCSKYHLRIQMTEYTLPVGTSLHYDPSKDYVFCKIIKKSGRRKIIPIYVHLPASSVVEQPKPYDAVKLVPYDDALAAVKSEPYDDGFAAVKLEPDDDGFATAAEPMDYESESQTPSLPQLMHKMTKIKF